MVSIRYQVTSTPQYRQGPNHPDALIAWRITELRGGRRGSARIDPDEAFDVDSGEPPGSSHVTHDDWTLPSSCEPPKRVGRDADNRGNVVGGEPGRRRAEGEGLLPGSRERRSCLKVPVNVHLAWSVLAPPGRIGTSDARFRN